MKINLQYFKLFLHSLVKDPFSFILASVVLSQQTLSSFKVGG